MDIEVWRGHDVKDQVVLEVEDVRNLCVDDYQR